MKDKPLTAEKAKKRKKKKTCSQANSRTEKGRFPKGVSGNPGGRPTNQWRDDLEDAIKIVQKKKRKKFMVYVVEQAYINHNVLVAVLKKLLPDLRTVEGDIKHSGNLEVIITN